MTKQEFAEKCVTKSGLPEHDFQYYVAKRGQSVVVHHLPSESKAIMSHLGKYSRRDLSTFEIDHDSTIYENAKLIFQKFASETSKAAAAMGKKGGSVKSEKKTAAVRENGKLGGRPNLKYSIESKISPEGWNDASGEFMENTDVISSKKEALKALARAKAAARKSGYTKEFIASLHISTFDPNDFNN